MGFFGRGAGLMPVFPSPSGPAEIMDVTTEEAAVRAPSGSSIAVTPLVREGELVAQGAAVACLRHAPNVCLTAPIAGRVARISLLPGRKLSEIVLFREEGAGRQHHDVSNAGTTTGLRRLMQEAGFWPLLRRRPFGGMPAQDESPAAVFVMASDTRPFAFSPAMALHGREKPFADGLEALTRITSGPVFLCQPEGATVVPPDGLSNRIKIVFRGQRHPQGAAGLCIHENFPAGLDVPVWDINAEDVANLGNLIATGEAEVLRTVHIAGAALREAQTVRTHSGADLRQLTQRIVAPGPHVLMSGSPLDGHPARWLGPRDRQITVLPRSGPQPRPHWLISALTASREARPVIPTAALTQALASALPAAPFVRALAAGDDEGAISFGLLSLLEEDIALLDYVLSEGGTLPAQLRAMLDRIAKEFAA